MSLLGAIAIDFIDHLKQHSKNWTIKPLVVWEDAPVTPDGWEPCHDGSVWVKRVPPNVSPTAFYIQNPPVGNHTMLLVKRPKQPLRAIGLEIVSDVKTRINLTYWRASGFVQRQESIKCWRRKIRDPIECPDGYDQLILFEIRRVVRTSKKTAKPRDNFDLTAPETPVDVLKTVVATIDKSYKWHGRGKRERFTRGEFVVMVDFDGHNYEMDDWLIHD